MLETYVIMAIPLKCVAILFRMSPEGNTTLSANKAYNGYHPCHRVLWINPAANITFSVITLETPGIRTLNPGVEEYSHALEGDCHDDVDFRL